MREGIGVGAATLANVAQDAGVSLATASRVLNGSARVPGEAVAARVRASAQRLGYVANAQAQALARSTSGLLGLVVHDIADPYFSTVARGVQQAAGVQDRQVLLAQTYRDPEAELQAVNSLISQRVDAIILVGSRQYGSDVNSAVSDELAKFVSHGGKVTVVGQPLGVGNTLVPRNEEASAELARQLVKEGHTRFAVLAGSEAIRASVDRARGFISGLTDAGLTPEAVLNGLFTRDGGYEMARELSRTIDITGDTAPLCVFAVADVVAIGAIAQFRREGFEVPRDVGVAGFGDIPTLSDFHPSVTSVWLPLEEMGRRAVEAVMSLPAGGQRSEYIDGKVVLRESTRLLAVQ